MKKIKQLPEKLQVPYLREKYGRNIYLGIGFDPHLFVFKNHKTWMVKEWIFERMVEKRFGNTVRCCLYGNWRDAFAHVHHPFKRDDDKVFLLPDPKKLELDLPEEDRMAEVEKYINRRWLRRIIRNTENAIKRGITVILDFNVQWQDWGKHWLNPKNCNRDVWGTTSGEWHYYEYWDKPGGEKIRRTGLIIENFERFVRNKLQELGKKWKRRQYIVFSAGNEVIAGDFWHQRKSNIFDVGLHRKITSIEGRVRGFYWEKPIHKYFQYAIHGIGNIGAYEEWEEELRDNRLPYSVKWLPCCDGAFSEMPKRKAIKKLVYNILKDGNLGYELLHGKWESKDLKKWDFRSVKWLMKGFRKWRREQG